MIRYEILEEYPTYYLCKHPKGWKEWFPKMRAKLEEENGIKYVVIDKIVQEREGTSPDQVNGSFNPSKLFK